VTPAEIASKFTYGSKAHKKLEELVQSRLKMSEDRMSTRFKQIGKNEELYQAYVPEQDVDALRRNNRETSGIQDYRTIEIPYPYAILMTAHTYLTSVFLSRSPVLQLSGRHGEAETNRVAIESHLNYQVMIGEMMLPLYCWLLDPGRAGYGVVGHYWAEESVTVRRFVKEKPSFLGVTIPGTSERMVEKVEEVPGYRATSCSTSGRRTSFLIRGLHWHTSRRVSSLGGTSRRRGTRFIKARSRSRRDSSTTTSCCACVRMEWDRSRAAQSLAIPVQVRRTIFLDKKQLARRRMFRLASSKVMRWPSS